MGFIRSRIRSFAFAFKGLKELGLRHPNFQVHLLATVLVIVFGLYLKIAKAEWFMVLLCIGSVLTAEAFNSALEVLLDKLHPEQNAAIGKAKDMAAGAVLVSAIISAIIGLMIFVPYFL